MTTEKAIKILEKKLKDSLEKYHYQDKEKLEFEDALKSLITILKEQQKIEDNKPLTWNEIVKMYGEPIYVVDKSEHEDVGTWKIINIIGKQNIDNTIKYYWGDYNSKKYFMDDNSWCAYRRRFDKICIQN